MIDVVTMAIMIFSMVIFIYKADRGHSQMRRPEQNESDTIKNLETPIL